MVFFRNVQVRWMPIQGDTRLTIAAERPGASGDAGVLADRIELQNVKGRSPMPDITAEYRYGGSRGYVEIAGLLGRMSWDDMLADQFDLSGDATRWGINLSSNVKLGSTTTLRLQMGLRRRHSELHERCPGGCRHRRQSRQCRHADRRQGHPADRHGVVRRPQLEYHWSTSVGYSGTYIDNVEGQAANAYRTGHYALGNLLYTPVPGVMMGGELQWGKREMFQDPYVGEGLKLQFSFRYNFSVKAGG